VIDGLDASGKSTQADLLSRFLSSEGRTVCVRSHPSDDNFLGIEARHFLDSRGRSAHFASALCFMLDAIRSVLVYSWQRYDYTIFVRYLMGTAYLPSPMHKFAYRFFALLVPKSDSMFFLDTTPEVAYRRIREGRKTREMFEEISSLREVRAKGLSLASIGAWTVIDADGTPSEVELEIRKHLRLRQNPEALPSHAAKGAGF
jgi:dTMP kinase